MEPVHQQPAQPVAKPATPPVMDVVPPRPLPAEPLKMPPQETGPLPVAKPDDAAKPKKEEAKKTSVVKPPKPLKTATGGAGLAVFATIVIVLGLGAMMVYAYLRTNGISIM